MRTPVDIEALRRRGLAEHAVAILRLRLQGRTRREAQQALQMTAARYNAERRRAAAILRGDMAAVEQAIEDAAQRRVREIREQVHLMEHDVLEEATAMGDVWRRGAFGQPQSDPLVGDDGRPVLPRARAFRAEDILAY